MKQWEFEGILVAQLCGHILDLFFQLEVLVVLHVMSQSLLIEQIQSISTEPQTEERKSSFIRKKCYRSSVISSYL